MKAEIIAIGSELLLGQVVNTNATYLSQELNRIGIDVLHHSTVGDNPERMKEVFSIACKRSDLVICTGGLGPTPDDITNETWGDFFNLELFEDAEQLEILKAKFKGREIPPINFKQARRPKDTRVIPNHIGTAPGIILESDYPNDSSGDLHPVIIMTFPGVPVEMEEMLQSQGLEYLKYKLKERGEDYIIVSRDLRITGLTEAAMTQKVQHFMDSKNPSLAPYATLGECRLRITAKAETKHQANNMIQPLQMKLEKELGSCIYGYDDDTLAGVVANRLKAHDLTIAFAESCTGGLLSKLMTDIPGSSSYTKVNLVTYANESKSQFINVAPEILSNFGAVSPEVAKEMVLGLSKISNSDINVSITGIAGPDGATTEKPIGTIYVGMTYPSHLKDPLDGSELIDDRKVLVTKLDWYARPLNREQVRELAAKKTLDLVRKVLT